MKKILLLVTAFLGISAGVAQAACTGPAVMHDFPGTSFNMSLGTTPDGNCGSNILITTWGGVTLGAPSNYGTSPGAVAVPGVNAFVTNTVSVTGTFWQATQPVSGTFWQTTQPVSVASGAAVDGWDVTAGTKADVPCTLPASSTACSEVAIQKAIANGVAGPMAALIATAWNTNTYGNGSTSPLNANLNGSLFVSQSPAAPISASMQTAAVANGNGNNLNVTGTAGAVLTVNCATCSGGTQVNFQVSQDGTNFASINAIQLPGGSAPATSTTTSGITLWSIQVPAGATALRATVSAYSAGTVTVTGEAVPVGNGLPSASISANGGTLGNGQALVKGTTAAMTGTSATQIIAAVTGQRIYPNRYKCNNSSATDTLVQITDGSGGTVLDTLLAKAGAGEVSSGATPLTWTTAGNGLYAQDVTTGASVICSASGYSGG
jgi:hypothetical protein